MLCVNLLLPIDSFQLILLEIIQFLLFQFPFVLRSGLLEFINGPAQVWNSHSIYSEVELSLLLTVSWRLTSPLLFLFQLRFFGLRLRIRTSSGAESREAVVQIVILMRMVDGANERWDWSKILFQVCILGSVDPQLKIRKWLPLDQEVLISVFRS